MEEEKGRVFIPTHPKTALWTLLSGYTLVEAAIHTAAHTPNVDRVVVWGTWRERFQQTPLSSPWTREPGPRGPERKLRDLCLPYCNNHLSDGADNIHVYLDPRNPLRTVSDVEFKHPAKVRSKYSLTIHTKADLEHARRLVELHAAKEWPWLERLISGRLAALPSASAPLQLTSYE